MKKIIIRDFIDNPSLAVSLVSRCLSDEKVELLEDYEPLFTFTGKERRILVATVKNKESLRFDVYQDTKQNT